MPNSSSFDQNSSEVSHVGIQVRRLGEYGWAIGIIAVTSGVALALRRYLQTTDVAMLFLLAVVVVAYRHRRGPAVVASLLSIAVFDFGFVPPYATFSVHEPAFLLTFVVMLGVALTMSQLTGRIREQADEARERERLAATLYAMSRELAAAGGLTEQIAIVRRHVSNAGRGEVLVLFGEDGSEAVQSRWPVDGVLASVDLRVAAAWAWQHGELAGWGTPRCAEAEALVIPLRGATRTGGILILRPNQPDELPPASTCRLLEALADQGATSLERALLAERHEQARIEVESEQLRTALLSSLSHDLRTPLGTIEGAASSLLQESGVLSPESQRDMAETIVEESRRMTRLVANLLDMVRVETGALAVQREWQPLEEALGVALLRLDHRLNGRTVETDIPATLPLVPIDELLVEQVFINLLENAIRHTVTGSPIRISAWAAEQSVIVEVADQGDGIPAGEEEAIFRKFYRSPSAARSGPAGGSGLGLTICRGIITAHGGRIWLERDAGKGAAFRFTLPLNGPPRAALPEETLEA